MAFCERLSESLAVVGTVDPAAVTGLISTDVIDMSLHRRCLFTLMTGAVLTTGILVEIQEGTVAVPNSAIIITSAIANQAAIASQYIFEVSAEAMADTYTVLRGDFTPDTGASLMAVLCQADVERYHPGSDQNLASAHIIGVAN